jgi:type IV pilus assembly protein PilQ
VEIEARIVEATARFAQKLGIQLGFQAGNPDTRYRAEISLTAPVDAHVGKAYISAGRILDTFLLDAAVTAAETRGEARMLSKPRISAQNNTEARIVQGAKIPIPVQMNYTTNVRYETAALKLSVKPRIADERTVALTIRVENSVPDFTRTVREIPTILTSESETRLLVANGATTVIGGIFVETNRKGEVKVPGISGLPLVGRLFKRTDKDRETREILFFITSRIKATLD